MNRLKGRADDAYNVNEARRRDSLIFMYSCVSFSNRKMDRYGNIREEEQSSVTHYCSPEYNDSTQINIIIYILVFF